VYAEAYVGIRIGEIPVNAMSDITKDGVYLTSFFDPMGFLYTNELTQTESVMPCVLYRYQVTNDLYQTVGGDVVQVSPLMEEIAYGPNGPGNTILYDPFIGAVRLKSSNDPWGLYLLDTQPVVRGATYQYLLMRFDEETKEMDRIIPAGTVTIP